MKSVGRQNSTTERGSFFCGSFIFMLILQYMHLFCPIPTGNGVGGGGGVEGEVRGRGGDPQNLPCS